MVRPILASLFALALLWNAAALAENSTKVDGYTIHHNAFLTSELSPEMASRYGIRRSPNRAMVNISVIRDKPGTTGEPVRALVKVTATNLRGQVRQIPLREVREENAVYYLGEFLVENGQRDRFDVEVVPQGTDRTLRARFEAEFYTR